MSDIRPYLATFGRFLIAAIFLISGYGKITAPAMTQAYIAHAGLPFPLLAYLIAISVEIGCSSLLVVGFQTRIVALVMAGFTLATAFGFHHDFADQNQMMHFLKNISMIGGLLQVVVYGAGRFSLDGQINVSRKQAVI
jgi:putative oxidoreductase